MNPVEKSPTVGDCQLCLFIRENTDFRDFSYKLIVVDPVNKRQRNIIIIHARSQNIENEKNSNFRRTISRMQHTYSYMYTEVLKTFHFLHRQYDKVVSFIIVATFPLSVVDYALVYRTFKSIYRLDNIFVHPVRTQRWNRICKHARAYPYIWLIRRPRRAPRKNH